MLCWGLEDVQLSVFRLRYQWDSSDRAYPILPGVTRKRAIEAMQRTRRYFETLDPHALATRILEHDKNNPRKLQYIALDLPFHTHTLCWEVAEEDGRPEVRAMTREKGQGMLERELPEFKCRLGAYSSSWKP